MKTFFKAVILVVLLAAIAGAAATLVDLYRPYQGYSGRVIVDIPSRTSAPSVARLLQSKGVLAYRLPFLFRYAYTRARFRLKSGEYLFDRPLRPIDVYWTLVKGQVYLHPVVIPEGSDRFDMARIFQQQLGVNPQAFLRATKQTAIIHDLDPKAPTLEGYLFPDTYRFARGVTPAEVVMAMVGRFRQVLNEHFQAELSRQNASLHDVITLASLVEKETPSPAERPLIAGVFERRLAKGWPLACDPTVIYAEKLSRRLADPPLAPLTHDDLQITSTYNTYMNIGLPPGPIASPGRASIAAALSPAPGDALYFVSNDHGGHYFARTLAEHLRNVARYRAQLAEANGSSAKTAKGSGGEKSHSGIGGVDGHARREKPKAVHSRVRQRKRSRPNRAAGDS